MIRLGQAQVVPFTATHLATRHKGPSTGLSVWGHCPELFAGSGVPHGLGHAGYEIPDILIGHFAGHL